MNKLYINFNNLDEDTQDYLLNKAEETISQEKKNEIKELADSSNINSEELKETFYNELLRTEAESQLYTLDIEFSI